MAHGPDVLVKFDQNGETVYLFCTSYKRFASSKLKQVGKADLDLALTAGTQVTGVILSADPPPGPTLLGDTKATSLDWEAYAARVQVGP